MNFELIAVRIDRHIYWMVAVVSVLLHHALILSLYARDPRPSYIAPEKPVSKVRILSNPNGNPAVTRIKVIELAKPQPKPKPKNQARAIAKPKPIQEPPAPPPDLSTTPQSFGDDTSGGVVGEGISTSSGDSDPGVTSNWQPIEQEKPQMPREAAERGIEGSVEFQFDINEEGRPENIKVVGGENRRLFEAEARKALRRWRYAPRIVNGEPVRTVGHTVIMNFKFDN